jgi:hypothetical protein
MIKTAEQILAGVDEPVGRRKYPSNRRSRLTPPYPCKNADRGCTGHTGGKRAARGWCDNCYGRWYRHGDSWYHAPNYSQCRKPCFMGHNRKDPDAQAS